MCTQPVVRSLARRNNTHLRVRHAGPGAYAGGHLPDEHPESVHIRSCAGRVFACMQQDDDNSRSAAAFDPGPATQCREDSKLGHDDCKCTHLSRACPQSEARAALQSIEDGSQWRALQTDMCQPTASMCSDVHAGVVHRHATCDNALWVTVPYEAVCRRVCRLRLRDRPKSATCRWVQRQLQVPWWLWLTGRTAGFRVLQGRHWAAKQAVLTRLRSCLRSADTEQADIAAHARRQSRLAGEAVRLALVGGEQDVAACQVTCGTQWINVRVHSSAMPCFCRLCSAACVRNAGHVSAKFM